jgi:hypothetical protein
MLAHLDVHNRSHTCSEEVGIHTRAEGRCWLFSLKIDNIHESMHMYIPQGLRVHINDVVGTYNHASKLHACLYPRHRRDAETTCFQGSLRESNYPELLALIHAESD